MSPRDQQKAATATSSASPNISRSSSRTTEGQSSSSASTAVSELQATASMCHHCFDVLLKELKNSSSSSMNGIRGRLSGWNGSSSSSSNVFHSITASSGGGGNGGGDSTPEFVLQLPSDAIECPLFVTWDKRQRGGGTRGKRSRLMSAPLSSSLSLSSSHRQQHRQNHHRSKHIGLGDDSNNDIDEDKDSMFELRGCIGTLSPKPLATSIGEYALISALRDKRFDPVTLQELPDLRVAVSLLVRYEECEHCHDWSVGVHGIMIRFGPDDNNSDNDRLGSSSSSSSSRGRGSGVGVGATYSSAEYSATYLPEVALEQGWDQRAAVASLIRKAGYRGRVTDDLLRRVRCTRYQSSKHRVTFDEYASHRGVGVGGETLSGVPLFLSDRNASGGRGSASRRHSHTNSSRNRDASPPNCLVL